MAYCYPAVVAERRFRTSPRSAHGLIVLELCKTAVMHRLALRLAVLALTAAPVVIVAQSRPATAAWPHWRGPGHTGATTANVPLTWSDTSNVRWKVEIPGRGHSTPVASGDRLFLTTAVPTGKKTDIAPAPGGRGGAGGGAAAGEEHRLEVLAVDRASGKILWQQTAVTATPHEGYHRSTAASPRTPRRRTVSASTRSSARAVSTSTT